MFTATLAAFSLRPNFHTISQHRGCRGDGAIGMQGHRDEDGDILDGGSDRERRALQPDGEGGSREGYMRGDAGEEPQGGVQRGDGRVREGQDRVH
ncbi:UNVERIFIED_CONTAM: hypothetical protein Slati_3987700 [Sesamum latifolium]|uniref:Uncharacterized protein n=1 Tax=Sesamum latifolium TaxID=2727402 RepID=A0AAW2TP97_9LAMI